MVSEADDEKGNKCKHCFEKRIESISVIYLSDLKHLLLCPPFICREKGKRPTRLPQKCRINGSRCQEHQDFVLVRGQRDGIATDSSTLVKVDGPAAVSHLWVVTAFGNTGAGRAVVLFRRLCFLSTFVSLIGSLAEPG